MVESPKTPEFRGFAEGDRGIGIKMKLFLKLEVESDRISGNQKESGNNWQITWRL